MDFLILFQNPPKEHFLTPKVPVWTRQVDFWSNFRPLGEAKTTLASTLSAQRIVKGAVVPIPGDALVPIFAQSAPRNARKCSLGRFPSISVCIYDGFWIVSGPFLPPFCAQTSAMDTITRQKWFVLVLFSCFSGPAAATVAAAQLR